MIYLFKRYYSEKEEYLKTYKDRFDFEETFKMGLYIKPYQQNDVYQLYYVYNKDTDKYISLVKKIIYTWKIYLMSYLV